MDDEEKENKKKSIILDLREIFLEKVSIFSHSYWFFSTIAVIVACVFTVAAAAAAITPVSAAPLLYKRKFSKQRINVVNYALATVSLKFISKKKNFNINVIGVEYTSSDIIKTHTSINFFPFYFILFRYFLHRFRRFIHSK